MSNDNLDRFMKKQKDQIDQTYSFLTSYRIYEGIDYLKSNSLIHRDLKPSNILIDHDFIPYISDFEFIRPINIENNDEMTN